MSLLKRFVVGLPLARGRLAVLQWLAGALMLALTAVVYIAWTRPGLAELEARALANSVVPDRPALRPERAEAPDALQWRAALPAGAERQQRLADLLEISVQLGLNAPRTEHRLLIDRDAGIERLRITMPVQGSYEQLRRFISAALAHDPALSLDGLRLRRVHAQTALVEADLQWSLHAQAQPQEGRP